MEPNRNDQQPNHQHQHQHQHQHREGSSPTSSSGSSNYSRQMPPEMTASAISHLELPPASASSSSPAPTAASASPARHRYPSSNNHLAPPGSFSSPVLSASGTNAGDDSALDALLLAHQRDASSDSLSDNRKDDQNQNQNQHYNPASHHHHHHHHHPHPPQGTTSETGAPKTTNTSRDEPDGVPTVSATGMPRFLPRRTSDASSSASDISEKAQENVNSSASPLAPSGSLLLAAFSSNPLPISRRFYLITAALAVNLGLPFLNGVMLGFGEIFARAVLAPMLGLAPSSIHLGPPGSASASGGVGPSPSDVGPRRPVASGLGIGLNSISRIGKEKDGSWTRAGSAQLDSLSLAADEKDL